MFRYELKKVIRGRLFLAITLAALAAGVVVIHYYEKNTVVYHCVRDESVADDFYVADLEEQKTYIDSYAGFIGDMVERADEIASISIFSEDSDYLAREIEKSCKDYENLTDIVLETGNCFGIRGYAGYALGIWFVIAYAFVTAGFLVIEERESGMAGLLRPAKRGRRPLGLVKYAVQSVLVLCFALAQEAVTLLCYAYLYGFGSTGRFLQSVSLFRNCSYRITVVEAIIVQVAVRCVVAFLVASVVYAVVTAFYSTAMSALVSAVLLGGQLVADFWFETGGTFDWFKTLNIFYPWSMEQSLGEYHNLNVFGIPVDKNLVFLVLAAVLTASSASLGVLFFGARYQAKRERGQNRVVLFLRRKTAGLTQRASIAFYEMYKLLVQQGKWVLLLLFFAWCAASLSDYGRTDVYYDAAEVYYHQYLTKVEGRATGEKIAILEEEGKQLEALREQINQMTSSAEQNQIEILVLSDEYSNKRKGYDRILDQLEYMKAQPGKLGDKYFVDELGLAERLEDVRGDVLHWCVAAVVLLLLVSGLYSADRRYGMEGLIASTAYGQGVLAKKRRNCVLLLTALMYLAAEIPVLTGYLALFRSEGLAQKMSDLSNPVIPLSLSIGAFLALVFLLKLLLFLVSAALGTFLARGIRQELYADIAGGAVFVFVAFFAVYFGQDLTTWVIGMARTGG